MKNSNQKFMFCGIPFRKPFWTHFATLLGPILSYKYTYLSRVALGAIWGPCGCQLAQGWAQEAREAPKETPEGPQDVPGGPQEAPGSPQAAPGRPQEAPRRSQRFPEAPRRSQRFPEDPNIHIDIRINTDIEKHK